jgi:C1A family cysteine protease
VVVDRIGLDNPIEDQGNLGSCTGNASTSMLEIKLKTSDLSRLMAYYNGRVIDGTTLVDDGAQIRSVIKGLMQSGVSLEKTWPYDITKFAQKPTPKAFTEAKTLVVDKIAKRKLSYQRVLTLNDLLNVLATGNTVTFGFMVPQSFEALPASGVLALPKKNEPILGGHAVVAVGYDLRTQFVWVRNSWGSAWALDGYFSDSRRLVDDMWTLQ